MAVVVHGYCLTCNKKFITTIGSGQPRPIECSECISKEKDTERRKHFGGLNALTIEERIRKIEEWIYDHKCSPSEIKL